MTADHQAPRLILAPLKGFTDVIFRDTFAQHFDGFDSAMAPFIATVAADRLTDKHVRDLLPNQNTRMPIEPQILGNTAEDFVFLARRLFDMGYPDVNWNLGCPYPMVTNRGLGAGLLADPQKIKDILNHFFSESELHLSIKMRLGNKNPDEILQVLPILEKFPLKNITIHPRIAKQMYKGEADTEAFGRCLQYTSHKVIYNGDITSVDRFQKLAVSFPSLDQWMIGRGLIADPFLPAMIKANTTEYPENKNVIFANFHERLLEEYRQTLSGDGHLVMKMVSYWEYFSHLFPNEPKGLKMIKKAKNIAAYQEAVRWIAESEQNSTGQ